MGQVMFLAINKKKLKELSNSKLTLSSTKKINGGATTPTDKPSKTVTLARCAVAEGQQLVD